MALQADKPATQKARIRTATYAETLDLNAHFLDWLGNRDLLYLIDCEQGFLEGLYYRYLRCLS